jgi:hypothetical protein
MSRRDGAREDGMDGRSVRREAWCVIIPFRGWTICPCFFPFADIRLPASKAAAQQRSINLAISSRGIAALEAIDPAASGRFLETVIPMRGRMIHDMQGRENSQLYDRDGQVSMLP